MTRKDMLPGGDDDNATFKRRFKYGLMGFAVVEFLVFVFVFIYKLNH